MAGRFLYCWVLGKKNWVLKLWVLGGMSFCWLVLGIALFFRAKLAGWSFSNHINYHTIAGFPPT